MEANKLANNGICESLLVVEADVHVRVEIGSYLRDCGYRVFEASTAEEAMSIIEDRPGLVDLVLADAQTPGLGGFGLARWIRTKQSGPAIILTGGVDKTAEAAVELCEEGPSLKKPYDVQVLVDRIRRALASRRDGS